VSILIAAGFLIILKGLLCSQRSKYAYVPPLGDSILEKWKPYFKPCKESNPQHRPERKTILNGLTFVLIEKAGQESSTQNLDRAIIEHAKGKVLIANIPGNLASLKAEVERSRAYVIKPDVCDAHIQDALDELQNMGFDMVPILSLYDAIVTCELSDLDPVQRQPSARPSVARPMNTSSRLESHTVRLVSQDFTAQNSSTQLLSISVSTSGPEIAAPAAHDREPSHRPMQNDVRGEQRVSEKRDNFRKGAVEPKIGGKRQAPDLSGASDSDIVASTPQSKRSRVHLDAPPPATNSNPTSEAMKGWTEQPKRIEQQTGTDEAVTKAHKVGGIEDVKCAATVLEVKGGQQPQQAANVRGALDRVPKPNIFSLPQSQPRAKPQPQPYLQKHQEIMDLEEPALRDADLENAELSGHGTADAVVLPVPEKSEKPVEVAVEGEWNCCQSQEDPSRTFPSFCQVDHMNSIMPRL
jgi:hypothetical protein